MTSRRSARSAAPLRRQPGQTDLGSIGEHADKLDRPPGRLRGRLTDDSCPWPGARGRYPRWPRSTSTALKLAQMEMTGKGKQAGAGVGLLGRVPVRNSGLSRLPADNRLFGGTGKRAVAGGLRSK
jgi:hypothetical protein